MNPRLAAQGAPQLEWSRPTPPGRGRLSPGQRCTRILLPLAITSACAPAHISPYRERHRDYVQGEYVQTQGQAKPAAGSIYTDATAGYLEDTRAVRVGDIVMVKINEEADAKGGASTALKHETSREDSVTSLLGLIPALQRAHPDMDSEALISLLSKSEFSGDGQTRRAGELTGRVAVRVKKEVPNGDLFIEGTKVVMINLEEYHLYISGLIRPADIDMDNSIQSSRIADAQVEFTGRGDIATTVERGWLTKLLDWTNPF